MNKRFLVCFSTFGSEEIPTGEPIEIHECKEKAEEHAKNLFIDRGFPVCIIDSVSSLCVGGYGWESDEE